MVLSDSREAPLAFAVAIAAWADVDDARTSLKGAHGADDVVDPPPPDESGGDGPRKDEMRPIKSVSSLPSDAPGENIVTFRFPWKTAD